MADRDINGMQARNWKKADVSALLSRSVKSKNDNVELFSAIKDVVSDAVAVARGDAKDSKYRYVVDMAMSRIRHALAGRDKSLDVDEFVEKASDTIADKITDIAVIDGISISDLSVKTLVDVICQSIQDLAEEIPPEKTAKKPFSEKQDKDAGVSRQNESDKPYKQDFSKASAIEKANISIQRLNSIGYSVEQSKKLRQFAQAVDDRIGRFQMLSGIEPMDISSIRDTDLLGKYITLAQEKLEQIYSKLKEYALGVQNRYARVVNGNRIPVKKQVGKPGAEAYGVYAPYLDYIENAHMRVLGKAQACQKSIQKRQSKTSEKLDTIYKLSKPRSLLDIIIDYVQNLILRKAIGNIIGKALKNSPIFKFIKDFITPYFNGIKEKILKKITSVLNGIKAMFKLAWKMLKRPIKLIWDGVKTAFKTVIKAAITGIRITLKLIWNAVKFIGKILWTAGSALFRFLSSAVSRLMHILRSKFPRFFSKLGTIFQKIRNFFSKFGKIFKSIGRFFGKIGDKLKNFAKSIKNFFSNIKTKLVKALKSIAGKLKSAAKSIIKAVKNVIVKIVQKVVRTIVKFVKKIVFKIMRKLGIGLAKKIAKKKAKKLGMKILIKFVQKFAKKLILKLSAQLASTAVVNVIPILGQVISVCMLLWTIYDTIKTVWEIYKMFEENPYLLSIVKEEIAKWADEAFNFFKDLSDWAGKIFSSMLNFFKQGFHEIGDAIFASNQAMNNRRMFYLSQLKRIVRTEYKKPDTLTGIERTKAHYDAVWDRYLMYHIAHVDEMNDRFVNENDSWWRDTDLMMEWMDKRQQSFIYVFKMLAKARIFYFRPSQWFTKDFMGYLRKRVINARLKLKAELEEYEKNKYLNKYYSNLSLNFSGLKKLLEELGESIRKRKEKLQALDTAVTSGAADAREKIEEIYPDIFDDIDTKIGEEDENDDENAA